MLCVLKCLPAKQLIRSNSAHLHHADTPCARKNLLRYAAWLFTKHATWLQTQACTCFAETRLFGYAGMGSHLRETRPSYAPCGPHSTSLLRMELRAHLAGERTGATRTNQLNGALVLTFLRCVKRSSMPAPLLSEGSSWLQSRWRVAAGARESPCFCERGWAHVPAPTLTVLWTTLGVT